jgi:hypothetical protein
MAAERQQRIAAGEVIPTTVPVDLGTGPAGRPVRGPIVPIRPAPGAIEAEILLVNDQVLTLPELLYPLREEIAELRKNQTPETFAESVRWLVRSRTQQAVGALLIYKEAMAGISDQQRKVIDEAVEREVRKRVSRDFGDSLARFRKHLSDCGLTLEQYRAVLERDLVARQYLREKLLPQITVRRDELLSWYRRNQSRLSRPETRELWMIEAPFESFLPTGLKWDQAAEPLKAQARLAAARCIQAAAEALKTRPFEEVAREYSRGPHAAQGGAWGEIGRPLQAPYDEVSKLIFSFQEGQVSAPVETRHGWYIVRCGRVKPAYQPSFAEIQEQLRQELTDRKFEQLSNEYMLRLAEKATLSSLDSFLNAAVRRAVAGELPAAASVP